GVKPVTVWLSEDFSRAAPGGTGAAKTGGNYAGGLLAQAQAAEKGCDQVVWLDSREHRWVEEMGGMNLCFVFGTGHQARLMTPALTGTLLPGITRDSLLVLGRDLGYAVEEGRISVDEWRSGCEDEILILSADRDRPYDRPYLSKEFLRSEVELPKVFLHEEADYVRERIDLRLASPVIGGSLRERTVTVSAGEVAFDVLVLGLGGTPRRPQGLPSA